MLLITSFMMVVQVFLLLMSFFFLFNIMCMGTILKIKPQWKLEVELNGAALMLSIKCVK